MRSSITLALASTLLVAAPGNALPQARRQCAQLGAAYMLTNQNENQVLSLAINNQGVLGAGTMIAAGGAGSASINAMSGQPSMTDPLGSQSALTVVGKYLFAVNAGSNTVSMFTIDKNDPTKLTMVGQPAPVPGEFPNTVTASLKNHIICVGMSSAKAGVSCAPFTTDGIGAMDAIRSYSLNQTTPPSAPPDNVSQVFFSDDEKMLYVTVRGNAANNKPGFFVAYPVAAASCESSSDGGDAGCTAGSVSHEGVISVPESTEMLFGSTAIPRSSNVFATDPAFGAAVLAVAADGKATLKGKGVINGTQALCWSAYSHTTKSVFAVDAANDRLFEMSAEDASVMHEIDLKNGQSGMLDAAIMKEKIYVLAPGNNMTAPAVVVVDVKSREQVQYFDLGSMGVTGRVQGMAVHGW